MIYSDPERESSYRYCRTIEKALEIAEEIKQKALDVYNRNSDDYLYYDVEAVIIRQFYCEDNEYQPGEKIATYYYYYDENKFEEIK